MLKTLSLTAVFVLCSFQSHPASSQTTTRQTEPRPRANHVGNPLAGSGETAAETNRRAASPEAVAEARRLYKEGVKYSRAGLFTQAAELFRRSVKLKPDYAEAYQGLGNAYFEMRRWQEAIRVLQQALTLNPGDKEARGQIAQAQLMLQRETGPYDEKSQEKSVTARSKPQQPTGGQLSLNVSPLPPTVPTTKVAANEVALTRIYRPGPGDVLDVRLDLRSSEPASAESTLFTITSSGLLEHPSLTAPLPITGLTVEEIVARLEDELKRRGLADNPKVSVGVHDYVSHAILVSGRVKEPGTKILMREAIPLYVVVADAQPLPEAARVTLVRKESNDVYAIDLAQPAEMNLLVHPGDVITLLANPAQFFYVAGEVKGPGEKMFRRGLTLTQAIIAAGGLTGKSREARVARDDGKGFLVVSRYKLKDIDSGKLPDPLIQPGDRITIVN
ncbi:MAG: tetratricopeptide repeat protein [Acidobacteriota bacterium]|nr:tetratricopeptide repeat protein [Acidobacteriota bacterium]